MTSLRPWGLALLLFMIPQAQAAEGGHQHHAPKAMASRSGCLSDDTGLACATQANPAFLADGSLVLGWVAGGRVMLARSADDGANFEPAIALNSGAETIDANTDARIAIASDGKGRVYAAWAVRKDARYNGALMLARSEDGGRSFSAARAVASDHTSQRFPALMVGADDRLTLAWIDKREEAAAKKAGKPYRGGALALAWSDDGGRSFVHEGIAQSFACECCRVVMGQDRNGLPVVMWRHIFEPNIRDHAILSFSDRDHPGALRKVSDDDWRVDACPHYGPSLAVSADGSVHAAWYSGGGTRKGLFYAGAPSSDGPFSAPLALGEPGRNPASPQVLSLGSRLWLAWKEFDGETSSVMAQSSEDGGKNWSAPRPIATTKDNSDRPVLLAKGGKALLSWMSVAEGWRLIALE
ncbi:MAG: exo-alpha-sialidase [Magnetospirillum sp.]|nr:exo-alpha-sialidase [Magnetospirillum sp.]